jgi:hypothetical protein
LKYRSQKAFDLAHWATNSSSLCLGGPDEDLLARAGERDGLAEDRPVELGEEVGVKIDQGGIALDLFALFNDPSTGTGSPRAR